MANKFSTNPMKIDTAFASSSSPFNSGRTKLRSLVWQPTAGGQRLFIIDRASNTVVDITALNAAPINIPMAANTWIDGLAVNVIGGGVLSIYV